MALSEWAKEAIKHGCPESFAPWLEENLPGHLHEMEDVEGLEDALAECGTSEDDDEEDEEEDDEE
jgi:hypothetical protein